jgi:hypothetical protein
MYDEGLVRRERPALDAMFGIEGRVDDLSSQLVLGGHTSKQGRLGSGASAAELGLRASVSDDVGGHQVQLENEVGRGRTCYLNMAVCEYGSVRLEPKGISAALDIRRRVRFILRSAGVLPPVYIRAVGMPTCLERMVLRAPEGQQLLAVRVNALESPELLAGLIKKGPVEIQLSFPNKTILRNLLTQKTSGSATTHVLSLDPSIGIFLEVEKGGR